MQEYPSNSHKSRMEQPIEKKKVEKVVTGTAKVKRKSEIKKFADIFLAEDIDSVKSYVINDVIIPKVKDTIMDIANALLYGGGNRSSKSSSPASRFSYGDYYNKPNRKPVDRSKPGYDFYDITLDSRGEAEEVLFRMDEILEKYGMVSVGDFYDLVGVTGKYTDNKYGWTDIHSASVVPVRNGYMIKMPRATPLDL